MAKTAVTPVLTCECGKKIEIPGRRIGDSVHCPGCSQARVVLRSKVDGDVLPAEGAPHISDRLPEVQESLARIRLRHAGNAARDVALYPPLAVFATGAFGFYISAILQGQNLIALGSPREGRRLQVLGVSSYFALAAILLLASLRFSAEVPGGSSTLLAVGLGSLVLGVVLVTLAGQRRVRAAFEAGARPASPLFAGTVGCLLAIAQLFVFKFIDRATSW